MYESKYTDDEKKLYERGYRDGEDHVQLQVFRILQKHRYICLSEVAQKLLATLHREVAGIPAPRNIQLRPHVVTERDILDRDEG